MRNRSVLLAMGLLTLAAQSQAGLLYSFETGTEGWYNPSWSNGGDVTFTQDTVGATEGSHSARVDWPNSTSGNAFHWIMVDNVSGARVDDLLQATQLMVDIYHPNGLPGGWFNGKPFMQEMFGGWNWREGSQISYSASAGFSTITFNISAMTALMVAGQPYRVGFSINGDNANHKTFYMDNVRTDTPVPEPATVAVLALGGLALLRRRR